MNTTPVTRHRTLLRRCLAAAFCTVLLAGCAKPPLNGQDLAIEKGCIACHGDTGVATASAYPNLNGQWEQYLRLQLIAYRSGRRENGIMNGFAMALTDDEIRALAAFYGI